QQLYGAISAQTFVPSGVLNTALTSRAFPVFREPLVLFWVFHLSLPRWPGPVLGETLVVCPVFDAPLASRAFPISREPLVLRGVFHAALTARLHFRNGSSRHRGGFCAHALPSDF